MLFIGIALLVAAGLALAVNADAGSLIGLISNAVDQQIEKLRMGRSNVLESGHTLVLGWSPRLPVILSELVIAAVSSGEDPGAPGLLARYQRARRPDNLLMLGATDVLDRLFSTDNPVVRTVRDLGIAGVHRVPALKRAFMRAAMGG